MTLLALQYGDRVWRTWAAQDQAKENNILIREVECQIDVGLFFPAPTGDLTLIHYPT